MQAVERVELAIYRVAEGTGKGRWRATSIGNLANLAEVSDPQDLTDALLRLHEHGFLDLTKFVQGRFEDFSAQGTDVNQFFYTGEFRIRVTHRGRPHLEQLEQKEKLGSITGDSASAAASRDREPSSAPAPAAPSFRDPYPTTLQGVRDDMDYWVTRQGEGQPGSLHEEGVRNRLEHLRNLEDRFRDEERETRGLEHEARGERALTFHTAFNTFTCKNKQPLGSGGTGVVYEAEDVDGSVYAVKVLNATADSQKLRRFKNEMSFCSGRRHKNIVRVLDYGVSFAGEGKQPFYVMPLYGGTLRSLIRAGIRPGEVLPLYAQILEGIHAAHGEGVWHRDVKPENILHDVKAGVLVIADFGIAHFREEDLYTAVETSDRERLANFLYSAPEQRLRGKTVDKSADIYALGLILNEMFTLEVPQGTGYRRIANASQDFAYLDEIVDQMIQQDPKRRPSIENVRQTLSSGGKKA